MDKFEQYEQDDRALFRSILEQAGITEHHPSTEKCDCIDYYYTYKGNVGVELKKRHTKYLDYDTLLMEVYKFNAIASKVKNKELDRALYVNFIGNDTVYIFNLRNVAQAYKDGKIIVKMMNLPATTASDSGNRDKRVLFIPKSVGTKLIRKGDKWIKSL